MSSISRREVHGRASVIFPQAAQTPDRYHELQDQVARFRGLESGYTRAEAFVWQQQSPMDFLI
jgi:hypothetical protein